MAKPAFWGTQFLVNTTIKSSQDDVKLHALKNGTFLAVWEDYSETGGDTSDGAVRGQIFNADGTKKGGEFLINTTTNGHQVNPEVTVLNDGRFVVAWDDYTSDAIMARAYSGTGALIGSEFQIAKDTPGAAKSIVALSDGGFAVAFLTWDSDITVQSFNATLQPVGLPNLISSETTFYDTPVLVAMQGRYGLSYRVPDGGDFTVHQRIFNNDGSAAAGTSEFASATQNMSASGNRAATLANGSNVLAWSESGVNAEGKQVDSIKAQLLNPDGSKRGGEIVIQSSVDDIFALGDVTHLADGGFVVAYFSNKKDHNSEDLYLAVFNSSGVRVASDMLVEQAYQAGLDVGLSTLADGRVAVSWSTMVSKLDNMGYGLHAQIVDPRQKAVSLNGSTLDDQYVGSRFNDRLKGAAGNDRLEGGDGKDTLTGDAGKDLFVFRSKPSSSHRDKIADFKVKDDSIWLDNAVFTMLGKSGTEAKPAKLNRGFFTTGDKAKDKNDYLIYDSKKGVLLYDADGSGKGKAVEIATLSKNLKMTYHDFFVI